MKIVHISKFRFYLNRSIKFIKYWFSGLDEENYEVTRAYRAYDRSKRLFRINN